MPAQNVLVACLNWGLGHATRCVPIIQKLLERGHRVVLSSDGRAGHLLRAEFPQLTYYDLPSYGIRYEPGHVLLQRFIQARQVRRAVGLEQEAVRQVIAAEQISTVLSDNRYGIYSPTTQNILLTHQLDLPLPWLYRQVANRQLRRWLGPFQFCWIPDVGGSHSLSGTLSAPEIPIPKRLIGPLSRLAPVSVTKDVDLCAVLSGPEPQRTLFEAEVLRQLATTRLRSVAVLGKTEQEAKPIERQGIRIYHALTTQALGPLLSRSQVVIARSGYSTLMDLQRLGAKAILVPTPRQPEQQYLAQSHGTKPYYLIQRQGALDLQSGFDHLRKVQAPPPVPASAALDMALEEVRL